MDRSEQEHLSELFREDEVLYAGFRPIYKHRGDTIDRMAESNEIPLHDSRFMPVVLLVYLALRRILYLGRSMVVETTKPAASVDHLFTVSTDHGYRSYAFKSVGRELQARGENVVYLVSPSAAETGAELSDEGFEVYSHRELFGLVPLRALPRLVRETQRRMTVLQSELPEGYDVVRPQSTIARNLLFVEAVKAAYFARMFADDCTIHTFAPMPYLLTNAEEDQVFSYQHGLLFAQSREFAMALPFYRPLTYLTWGPAWEAAHRKFAHADSRIEAVGSPWLDHLSDLADSGTQPTYDVLLIGGSHACQTPSETRAYERLVETVAETCEARSWDLAIKLHPVEEQRWYDSRGWGSHVVEFDDIHDAILNSRASVANGSSAFIESSVLGRPVVVTDLFDFGFQAMESQSGLRISSLDDVPHDLVDAMHVEDGETQIEGLVTLGMSTERIISVVLDEREVSRRSDAPDRD